MYLDTKKGNSGIICTVRFSCEGSGLALDKGEGSHLEQLSAGGGKTATDSQCTGKVNLVVVLPPSTQNQDLMRNAETFSENKIPFLSCLHLQAKQNQS